MITEVKDITSFKWATVVSTSLLSIKLDGDTTALAMVPDSLIDPISLSVGDRVRVELTQRKVVIHGKASDSYRLKYTSFIPLPMTAIFRPWDMAGWGIRQGAPNSRYYDPAIPFWITKNVSGIVSIQGFAGSSVAYAAGATLAQLPVGYRPSTIRRFPFIVSDTRLTMEIGTDGVMKTLSDIPAASYVSFSNIVFHDVAQDLTWINITTLLNGFTALNQTTSPVSVAIDSFGFVWTRGILTVGATRTDGTSMFALPSVSYVAQLQRHFTAASDGNAYAGVAGNGSSPTTSQFMQFKAGTTGSYVSLDGIVWQPPALDSLFAGRNIGSGTVDLLGYQPFLNSWQNYDAVSFSPAGPTRRSDGLVIYQGLISLGVVATPAFYVPPTYRPLFRTAFVRTANALYARTTIDPNPVAGGSGRLEVETGATQWHSLDGLMFQSAQ